MIGKTNVQSSVTEKTVNDWGFTKNAGTVTGVKINGTTKSPNSSGIVDLGTIEGGSGGGGEVSVEGFIPLNRDFNDDFNDDFAR